MWTCPDPGFLAGNVPARCLYLCGDGLPLRGDAVRPCVLLHHPRSQLRHRRLLPLLLSRQTLSRHTAVHEGFSCHPMAHIRQLYSSFPGVLQAPGLARDKGQSHLDTKVLPGNLQPSDGLLCAPPALLLSLLPPLLQRQLCCQLLCLAHGQPQCGCYSSGSLTEVKASQ